jgi:Ca-activated chloride channel family protein
MPRNLGFASAVAEFGMLLRNSQYKGTASYDDVIVRAKEYKGKDDNGYRAEFIQLVEKSQLMKK